MTTTKTQAGRELLELFPPGTTLDGSGGLVIGGVPATRLAETYGTPALILDETSVRARARRYADGLAARWPNSRVTFASKAFPCTAVIRLLAEEGLGIDVAGGGELTVALAAGADPAGLVVHGNAKTEEELRLAVEAGAGTVVVDNFDDIDRLEKILAGTSTEQGVLVRVTPGIRPDTHEAVSTGQNGSKFGLPLPQAREAIARLRGSDRLRLDGVHVHVGSQILDLAPFAQAVEAVAELGEFAVYDLGGGLGSRYTYADRPPTVEAYLDALTDAARRLLPADARILIEPGRSMVAESGLSLYRVVSVKRAGGHTFVAVDGGMGDNLEVSLYQQRFEAAVADRPTGGGEVCRLVGRHCESGDTLSAGVRLAAPRVGDLIAVPATGAYTYALSNNYNGARRPPVVLVRDGAHRAVVRRETYADLTRRDLP
ncbi:diaminopimelate decarboxylase [Streptomyces sp. NPDC048507]|uniref:diaminopimelate decarboxylase n=1 Tax=Streptomyces sp. NPDC048507 TaxID=3365560 RepID=UPI0037150577